MMGSLMTGFLTLKGLVSHLNITRNVSLLSLNTLSLPGYAEFFCRVSSKDELAEALAFARLKTLPVTVLGGGSNVVLVGNVPGLLIHMAIKGINREQSGPKGQADGQGSIRWTAAGGENWHEFVLHTLANKSYGLENLSLIPGLVGAAPIQNRE